MIQLSYPYMTTGKTIVLTRWTFVGIYKYLKIFSLTCLERSGCMDFPGDPVIKNLPYNARDTGSIPGRLHMQLSPPATMTVALLPRAYTPQHESSPCSSKLEKACVQQQRPTIAYKQNKSFKKKKVGANPTGPGEDAGPLSGGLSSVGRLSLARAQLRCPTSLRIEASFLLSTFFTQQISLVFFET